MLNFFLNKGGAGVSISRRETVERLNPIIRHHAALNLYYDAVAEAAAEAAAEPEVAAQLAPARKTMRTDVGKLAESIYSAGGVAYTGTDLDPAAHRLDGDDDDRLFRLLELEQDFQQRVAAEFDVNHQIRTRAILENVRRHSQERLSLLKELTKRRRRKTLTP